MTRTARRRWSRELESQVDGVALGPDGPVILHVYDPPAGGKWLDDVIPGKVGALDRATGETLWNAPCEIGYGRGFGAGFGEGDEIVMLGPSLQGHSIARMAAATGEVIGAREIESFDEALVGPDLCVCVTPARVFGVSTSDMVETWAYQREGERYHRIGRAGDLVYVLYTHQTSKRQGVLCLHAETGDYAGALFEPKLENLDAMAVGGEGEEGTVVLSVRDLESALSPEALRDYLTELSLREDEDLDGELGGGPALHLLAMPAVTDPGARPRWHKRVETGPFDDDPEVTLWLDSGKLYAARGVHMDVHDVLTGRVLGSQTMPGLDEFVAWRVVNGAGLLAEETRVSIFEVAD